MPLLAFSEQESGAELTGVKQWSLCLSKQARNLVEMLLAIRLVGRPGELRRRVAVCSSAA